VPEKLTISVALVVIATIAAIWVTIALACWGSPS